MSYLGSFSGGKDILSIITSTSRDVVLKDLKKLLYVESFENLLDCSPVISHANGAYDLVEKKLRQALPSDYCSLNTRIDFTVYDLTSTKVRRLVRILKDIFMEPEVFRYFMRSCSTFLEGTNSTKSVFIWYGLGNNAKSVVQKLVSTALGDYCVTCPTALITGGRSSTGSATPELSRVNGKLVVFIQEPNSTEKIKGGQLKELSGNDTMYIRPLYEEPRSMVVRAKIVIVCNGTMEIVGLDSALRRRIHVIPFSTTFLTRSEMEEEKSKGKEMSKCRLLDPYVESELIGLADVFFYLLAKEYERFRSEGMVISPLIEQETREYLDANNHCLKFIRDQVVRDPYCNSDPDRIYNCFKDWFRRSFPSRHIPNFETFHSQLRAQGFIEDVYGSLPGVSLLYVPDF
jgi:P4 family phage/plasmid primase-like protien